MKYIVLYDTLINKEHTKKDSVIAFEAGTDEGYIKRLLANKVIAPLDSKDSKPSAESAPKEAQKETAKEPKNKQKA